MEDSFGRYGFLHFKNQDEWKILEEEDLDLKFKAVDRVFNKMTRKWVNIIEFDIETGLYIVRYDDGIQGRSLESELRFMEEKSKSHNNMCKQLIDEMIERKVGQVEKENQSREMLKENAKHYWEVITGGSKPKFKVGDRVLLALHPCVVNKVEWRGDSKYVGYVYTVRGTDFGKKVKEADLMLDPRKEETKSHNNMCKA